MEPQHDPLISSSSQDTVNRLQQLPSDLLNVIITFLPNSSDVIHLGATCRSMRKLSIHLETWQSRLKAEYNFSFNSLKIAKTPSRSPIWYQEYLKNSWEHYFLARNAESQNPAKVFDIEWSIAHRQGSRLGRVMYPLLVEHGRKIILRVDQNLRVLNASTGALLKHAVLPEEIGIIRVVNPSETLVACFGLCASLFILNLSNNKFGRAKFPPCTDSIIMVDSTQTGKIMCSFLTDAGLYVVRRDPLQEQHSSIQPDSHERVRFSVQILYGTEIILVAMPGKVAAYLSTPEGLQCTHQFDLSSHPAFPRVLVQMIYPIGEAGEAVVLFLLPSQQMRFLWFSPEIGFELLPKPSFDFGSLIKMDNIAKYRFSTLWCPRPMVAWQPDRLGSGVATLSTHQNMVQSTSSLCVPFQFNVPLAREWVSNLSYRAVESLDLVLPFGKPFIAPYSLNLALVGQDWRTLYISSNGSVIRPAQIHVWDLQSGTEPKSLRLDSFFAPREINVMTLSHHRLIALTGRKLAPQQVSGKIGIWNFSEKIQDKIQNMPTIQMETDLDSEDFELLEVGEVAEDDQ